MNFDNASIVILQNLLKCLWFIIFMDEFNKERGHGDGKFSTRGNYFTT